MGGSNMAKNKSPPASAVRVSSRKKTKVDYREKSEADISNPAEDEGHVSASCGSSGVKAYRDLLVAQKKELYKDPPQLPPVASLLSRAGCEPSLDGKTGEFGFKDYPDFRPNLSPKEVLQQGGFG